MIDKLVSDLHALGLHEGDVVLVHSSLSALGYIEGGADTVIDALKAAVGESGTLLFPALSFTTVTPQEPQFDIRTTPSCVGLIPETFRKRPETIRSMHPTHSVSAWGKYAREMTCDHHLDNTPVGVHSPFSKLPAYNGKVLMLGCSVRRFTFMHGVEEVADAPYTLMPDTICYTLTDYDGTTTEKDMYPHDFRGVIQRYDRVCDVLSANEYSVGNVLEATAYLFDAKLVLERGVEAMKKDPYFFVDKQDT